MIKNNSLIGFMLALTTAILWGTVPIAVKEIVVTITPLTLVWYRFLISAVLLFIFLLMRKRLPKIEQFKSPLVLILISIATIGLAANFILFSTALVYISATTAQLIAQFSSVGLLFASILVFKDCLKRSQILGIIILLVGFLLFFNTDLIELLTRLTDYSKGVFIGLAAAGVWVIYGLAQKILLSNFKAQQILFILYVGCTIIIFPFANLASIQLLSTAQIILLLYCGANTFVAYGTLVVAMERWQVSQVSAVITLTPLFTLIFSDLLAIMFPSYFLFAELNVLGYIGALIFVLGAMFISAGDYLIQRFYKNNRI